jgi:hypothetical protein
MYWLYSSSLAKSYDPLPLLLILGHVSCNVAHIVISWITKSTKYIPKNYIVMLFGNNFWQNLNVSILYLQFSYKAHVFVACILICCSYCWLHPIKNYNCVTTKVWLTWPGHMRLDIQVMANWDRHNNVVALSLVNGIPTLPSLIIRSPWLTVIQIR